jgi:beta-glucosidase
VSLSWEIHRNTLIGDLLADERTAPFVKELLQKHSPFGPAPSEEVAAMLEAFMKYMPLRNVVNFNANAGLDLDDMLAQLNRLVSST